MQDDNKGRADLVPQPQEPTPEAVERAAEAYWREVYGRHRRGRDNWPDDVVGQSQDLIRAGTRAALIAARKAGEGI